MTFRTHRPDLHQMVRQLIDRYTHLEMLDDGSVHRTEFPALLDQIAGAVPLTSDGDITGSGFGSKPTASIEAIDTFIRIDIEAARWVRDLGGDDPGDTKKLVRRLHSLMPSAHEVTRREIEADVRNWWTQARVASGWDTAPWKPDNTCPLCGQRGTLRVNLVDRAGYCVDCRETWDVATIGLLADHIRAENGEDILGECLNPTS